MFWKILLAIIILALVVFVAALFEVVVILHCAHDDDFLENNPYEKEYKQEKKGK